MSGAESVSELGRDRWLVVSPYLGRALEMEGGERTAWLVSLRADDPTLAADLKALSKSARSFAERAFLKGALHRCRPPRRSPGRGSAPTL
jgi:hypothetical protein